MYTATRSTGLRSLIVTAIFGALTCSVGTVHGAASSSASVNVKYADLNIATASGARVLYKRIRAAARSACSYFWFERDADEARCVQDAIANAVAKLNQPALSAVYDAAARASAPSILVSQSHGR